VLDHVPNDISVALGIITSEFQTPLSHVNVLSKNRGTPNMALRDAFTRPELRALDGKWVRLTVTAYDYEIEEVTRAEADAWWDAHRPAMVQVPGIDLSVTDLRDTTAILAPAASVPLGEAIATATRAFGGKAAHFGALTRVPSINVPDGFAIPVYYYRQFMQQNGFDARVTAMLADPAFLDSPAERDRQLAALRADMEATPLDAAFVATVRAKILGEFTYTRMRFRSSTNAEDLEGFTGAGLYTSETGDPNDAGKPIEDAIRIVWASVWRFKAFEERSYRGIDHLAVAMALLVHRSFPEEEANGVALTGNPFDDTGLNPAFYVNAQIGGASVVLPPPGVTTDQFLVFQQQIGLPIVYVAHSNLVAPGTHVLTHDQEVDLSYALDAIATFFQPLYGTRAMDIEWKLEGEPGERALIYIKQARPTGQ
jgi:pyruvate, water dikinase